MTTSSPTGATVDDIISRTRYVLLDFDGPVCDIYAGLPAVTVAERLRKLITGQGVTLPAEITSTADPIEVFIYSATIGPALAAKVEAEMTDQETEAVATSRPTPYVHDVVTSCRDSGRPIAVVSNNSDRAVRAYLALHGLDDRIELITARTSSDPGLLKPSPHLIDQAITGLGAPPGQCVLIGDSTTAAPGGPRRGRARWRPRRGGCACWLGDCRVDRCFRFSPGSRWRITQGTSTRVRISSAHCRAPQLSTRQH